MRTPDQCLAKADDLEREARASKNDLRRQAFLDLADHWRRLAGNHSRTHARAHDDLTVNPWARRSARVN